MSTSRFELLSIVLLGLGQMCIMTGYDTQSFISESVLHSIHVRNPLRIDEYAGYYGQAICYAAYMGACLIAPLVLHILSPKWILFLSSVCYTLYHIGFFYLNSYYYYISCATMGVGFALFYTGHGAYLTSHSTRKTIQQNSALAWSIACLCMLIGSGILATIFSITHPLAKLAIDYSEIDRISSDLNMTHGDTHSYRQFTDREIFLMYGTFTAVSICANIIFSMLPSREISNCIEGKDKKRNISFHKEMGLIFSSFSEAKMILLTALFIHLGFYTSFWVSVYPTTLVFTHSLSSHVYLPAFYSLFVGMGEIIMSVVITYMSYRIPDFGLRPTMAIGFCFSLFIIIFIAASVPVWSTVKLNNDIAWLIQPSFTTSIIIAFTIGMADSCVNNTRNVICALAMPDRRPQTYAISKFYQALAGTIIMFLSPKMSIYHYTALLFVSLLLSTIFYFVVAGQIQRMERKVQVDN